MAVAGVSGDTLAFRVTVLPGQEYPVTVDPSTTATAINTQSGYSSMYNEVYLTARNGIYGNTSSNYAVGQVYNGVNSYMVFRTFTHFSLPGMIACSACTLYVNGSSDNSTTDFTIHVYGARLYKPTLTGDDFKNFSNWAASGTYDSSKVMNNAWHSSSYSSAWNKIVFNSTGLDSMKAASGDTLWIALLSNRDVAPTTPTGEERIYFEYSTNTPYLSFTYSVPTINPPTDFFMTPIAGARDSMLITWTNNYSSSIDSLILKTWPDNQWVASFTKTATSARIGGLNPYTKYRWYVRADSAGIYGYANADSCYTTQTFKTENFNFSNAGYAQNAATAVYDSARAETNADSLSTGSTYLGQQKSGSNFFIFRHYQDVTLPAMTKAQAETLFVKGTTDNFCDGFFHHGLLRSLEGRDRGDGEILHLRRLEDRHDRLHRVCAHDGIQYLRVLDGDAEQIRLHAGGTGYDAQTESGGGHAPHHSPLLA
jgi:hypothetical protein